MKLNLDKFIVSEECSIINVVDKLNKNAKGIVFVCLNKVLIASVTDGDIRRSILSQTDMSKSIREIANYNPIYIYEKNEYNAEYVMKENGILSVPIVNDRREIVNICFRIPESVTVNKNLNLQVVMMAGGKGSRLKPYTDVLPKPLIPIGDKTISEHILRRFINYGCDKFTMIVNYKKEFIKAYYQDEEKMYDICFVEEEKFLGTGGGLTLLRGKMKETFFVTNCDILIEHDYAEILQYHRENKNLITVVGAEKKIKIPYGTMEVGMEGQIIRLEEKPEFYFNTNTGLYIIEPQFLEYIPNNTFIHITEIIENCIKQKERVGAYLINEEEWMDMGQYSEMKRMKEQIENR